MFTTIGKNEWRGKGRDESFNAKHQDSSQYLIMVFHQGIKHMHSPNRTQTQVKKTYLNFPHAVSKHISPVLWAKRIPKMQRTKLVEINIIPVSSESCVLHCRHQLTRPETSAGMRTSPSVGEGFTGTMG